MALSARRKAAIRRQLEKQKRRYRPKKAQGVESSVPQEEWYTREINRLTVRRIHKRIKQYVFPALDASLTDSNGGLQDEDPNAAVIRALERAVQPITDITVEAADLATEHFGKVNRRHKIEFKKSIEKAMGVNISKILTDAGIEQKMRNHVTKNVGLIKRIHKSYFVRVRKAITQGFASGQSSFSLKRDLIKIAGIEYRHARLIARDQTSKLNSNLNKIRQKNVGVTHYIWRTVGDERVRPDHASNNGERFSWKDPPATTGHPGNDIQCRCVADPDLSPLLDTVD